MERKYTVWLSNFLFILASVAIVTFLWIAPEETTAPLPKDEDHLRFMEMKKKEAEKFCNDCHGENGDAPLPETHPPKYRCLFCHKRN
jgi:cytochrome c553